MAEHNRYTFGTIAAECQGDLATCFPIEHSVPWGNWGVNSNAGNKSDSNQFWGYQYIDGNYQWDSCTSSPQSSNQGTQRYAFHRGLVSDEPCENAGLNGVTFTYTGQFMDIDELDWCDEDEDVATAYYPSFNTVLWCSGSTCYGDSGWISPSSVSPNVLSADIKVIMWAF
ncbi:MAG: hypothetical protein IT180_01525 [Acidobacteria bacterium]|nr:hypothetical protein [Acidobacteriota bacterium]